MRMAGVDEIAAAVIGEMGHPVRAHFEGCERFEVGGCGSEFGAVHP